MLTLEEAIQHCKDEAHVLFQHSAKHRNSTEDSCYECAKEHEQLAQWLEELRTLREIVFDAERKGKMEALVEMRQKMKVNSAAILRLCNEIEDIVSEISKLSENYLIYSDCKSILDRTKAIGKELTGDAGTD